MYGLFPRVGILNQRQHRNTLKLRKKIKCDSLAYCFLAGPIKKLGQSQKNKIWIYENYPLKTM
jgi:hypothetical protein